MLRLTIAAACVAAWTAACSAPPENHARALDRWRAEDPDAASDAAQDALEPLRDPESLEDLVVRAQQRHPAVRAAWQRWRAALEEVPQAAALPEPRLSLTAYLQEVETRVGPMQGRLGVTQAIPWRGKLSGAARVAAERAEAARHALDAARLRVREEIVRAWAELVWLAEARAVTQGHLELIRHVETISRAAFETGTASHADVVRAQVELGRIEDRLAELEDLEPALRQRLVAAAGSDAALELALPDVADWTAGTKADGAGTALDADAATALARHPEILAMDARIVAARSATDLAELQRRPDFFVGADWTWIGDAPAPVSGSGDDAFSLSLGLDLPIRGDSYDAAEARERARAGALVAERADLLLDLRERLATAQYRHRDADRRVALYANALLPKAQEGFRTTATAYQAGTAAFQDLLDSARVLLEFRLARARAEADRAQAWASIVRLLPDLADASATTDSR